MNFSSIEEAIKVAKALVYAIIALLLVIVFLGFSIYMRGNTIDKLNLSLTSKASEIYALKAQKVTLSSALDKQTEEVKKKEIDLKKAQEDLATQKPQIIMRYRTQKLDANATCEAQLNDIKQTLEVYHANR